MGDLAKVLEAGRSNDLLHSIVDRRRPIDLEPCCTLAEICDQCLEELRAWLQRRVRIVALEEGGKHEE